jgi:hypothetical protein
MPKRRRETDPIRDIIMVETRDGARLRCSIAAVGRETEPRWMIMDEDGAQFVGPLVTTDRSPDVVSRLIEDWWTTRSAEPARASADRAARNDAVADASDRTERVPPKKNAPDP